MVYAKLLGYTVKWEEITSPPAWTYPVPLVSEPVRCHLLCYFLQKYITQSTERAASEKVLSLYSERQDNTCTLYSSVAFLLRPSLKRLFIVRSSDAALLLGASFAGDGNSLDDITVMQVYVFHRPVLSVCLESRFQCSTQQLTHAFALLKDVVPKRSIAAAAWWWKQLYIPIALSFKESSFDIDRDRLTKIAAAPGS